RHRFLDDLLQFSTPSPGDEQPDADGGVARRHGQNRGGGEGCGYAASLGQRKRVAHIPTAEAEAARSDLILEGQGQARLHLKSNPSWSHERGPVQAPPPSLPTLRPRKPARLRQAQPDKNRTAKGSGKQPGAKGHWRCQPIVVSREVAHAPMVCAACGAALGPDLKRRCVTPGLMTRGLELVRGDMALQVTATRHSYFAVRCPCGDDNVERP